LNYEPGRLGQGIHIVELGIPGAPVVYLLEMITGELRQLKRLIKE
jgi:hypothetical protein